MKDKELENYKKAKKRVDSIKSFYGHLFWYLLVNIVIFITNYKLQDQYYLGNWVFLNFITTTLLWGIGVFIHGLKAFKPTFFSNITKRSVFSKDWEERKLKELLKEEAEEISK